MILERLARSVQGQGRVKVGSDWSVVWAIAKLGERMVRTFKAF